jgi:hypothetical protein
MIHLSPHQRDLISVVLLVLILLLALPLLGSLFADRAPASPRPTPTPAPTPTVELNLVTNLRKVDLHANLGITSLANNSMLSRSFLQKLVMNVCTPTSL